MHFDVHYVNLKIQSAVQDRVNYRHILKANARAIPASTDIFPVARKNSL